MANNPQVTIKYSNYNPAVKIMKFDSNNPELDAARIRVGLQKEKFENAKKAYSTAYLQALNFNGLEPGVRANQSQSQDYNNLRKYNSSFESTTVKTKEKFPNEKSYKLNGNALPTENNLIINPPTIVDDRNLIINAPNVESYRSADGTVYRHYHSADGVTKEANYPTKNVIHVPGKYHELYRQWADNDEIPQNIRHKFRTYETERLLADKIKVHDTLSKIHNTGIIKKKEKEEENPLKLTPNEKELLINEYYDLGNHLRHAISHGYPTVYHTGHLKTIHNGDVNKEFMENWKKNVETPHRRKTDWLSQWLELTVTDNKMLKDYKVFAAEQASKLPPIVRERVERPKTEPAKKAEKQKEAASSKKKENVEQVIKEEPIIEANEQPKESNKTDNEFWEYYDKNA